MTVPADHRIERADQLANQIMVLARNQLLIHLRFLDMAISQLKPQPTYEISGMEVNGRALSYNPWHILTLYQSEKELPPRNTLHVLFHCLFHHPFIHKLVHQGCWDLACDIAAENAINDLGLPILTTARQPRQASTIHRLKTAFPLMTAEKIYRYLLDHNYSDDQLISMRTDYFADDHSCWYVPEKTQRGSGQDAQASQDDSGDEGNGAGPGEAGKLKKSDNQSGSGQLLSRQELEDLWKQISERAQVDLETTSKKWGSQQGGLHQGLNQINREKYDYASFLQRFSVLGEVMQVNDGEFDVIFYTYGLQLYKNLPLIEPLEYKEVKRIKEFVIAIDTSGSVQGKTVQAFVQKTYNLLKQTENFFTRVNIHIVQCDTVIQEDAKITNAEEFERYIRSMTLRGFGGTDFRPVFDYVDTLIDQHEFENLRGVIYFTDGFGVYPTRKPAYNTAFVFLDEDYVDTPTVPSWAIKLVLSSDDILEE